MYIINNLYFEKISKNFEILSKKFIIILKIFNINNNYYIKKNYKINFRGNQLNYIYSTIKDNLDLEQNLTKIKKLSSHNLLTLNNIIYGRF